MTPKVKTHMAPSEVRATGAPYVKTQVNMTPKVKTHIGTSDLKTRQDFKGQDIHVQCEGASSFFNVVVN